MSARVEAALIAGGVALWLALGGCGTRDQVIDLMPGGTGGTGEPANGETGGRSGAGCESDRDCEPPTPYCDRTNQQCVECTSDADCGEHSICLTLDYASLPQEVVAAFDAGVLGSGNIGHCIECLRDEDCPQNSWCTDQFQCH
jgi:hypothetical protein